MRKPSLSVDTFVAALAVLGASASNGCSKADHASVAPEPAAAVAPSAPASKTEGAPAAAPSPEQAAPATAAAPAAPVAATAVDGGVRRAADTDGKKKAGMSCGAGVCSADMKKGTGN